MKLGSVNAMFKATIYDNNNRIIGYCGDTPNIIAYVFQNNSNAQYIKTPYLGTYCRNTKDMQERMHANYDDCGFDKYIEIIK